MVKQMPSSNTLVAFECAARLLSISAAARELHLTQSAVSRQIQALEQHLQVALFERHRQRIRLTPAGDLYLEHVRAAFERLEAGALSTQAQLGRQLGEGRLRLTAPRSLGSRWLIPLLSDFQSLYPAIELHLSTRAEPQQPDPSDFDAVICQGQPRWSNTTVERLMEMTLALVCSPDHLHRVGPAAFGNLSRLTLLHSATHPTRWQTLMRVDATAVSDNARRGPRFADDEMVIEAAIAGLGVAALPSHAVNEELLRGRLVEPIAGRRYRTGDHYHLVYETKRADLPALRAFREWLLQRVAE
jgi:LysR family glycine cleavage system transcriptional activator